MWFELIEIALKLCSENPKILFVENREIGADSHNSQLNRQNSNMNVQDVHSFVIIPPGGLPFTKLWYLYYVYIMYSIHGTC